MALEFTAQNQKIDFGTSANVYGLSQKSISFWINMDNVTMDGNLYYAMSLFDDDAPYTDEGWNIVFNYDGNGDLLYSEGFSTTSGFWSIPIGTFGTGSWYHVVITMDNTSDTNNPSAYVNIVSKVFTEDVSPSGSANTGTNGNLRIGDPTSVSAAYRVIDGKIEDPRIYNVILTPEEIAELYNSRLQRSVTRGLVFAPFLDGATGLSSYDGATLGTANTIVDSITGAVGVPNGSPIGRGNTIQRIY